MNTVSDQYIDTLLIDLNKNSEPYKPLWENWVKSKSCFLNQNEIKIINDYVIRKQSANNVNNPDEVDCLNEKLKNGYPKYKEWVILSFLFCIIEMAGKDKSFMSLPIHALNLNEVQKQNLNDLEIKTPEELFEKYTEEDLINDFVFKKITAFMMQNIK